MQKLIFTWMLFLATFSGRTQDACDISIRVNLSDAFYDETPEYGVVATAYDGKDEITVTSEAWFVDFLHLKPGKYTLTFRSMNYHTVILNDVMVEENKTTYVSVMLTRKDDLRYCNEECEVDYPARFFLDMDYFNPSYPAVNNGLKDGFQFRVSGWSNSTLSNRFDMGVLYSLKWGVQRLDSISAPLFASDANSPRLGWFKYGFGFGASWVMTGYKTPGQQDDFFINAGVTYDVPIIFRYKANYDDARLVKPKIHKWNEFNVEARLIYRYIGVNASYRLTEYIKGDLPELPRWWFGISFALPFNDEE